MNTVTYANARNLLQSHCVFEMTYSIMWRDPDFTTNQRDTELAGRGMGNIETETIERDIYLNNITWPHSLTDIQTNSSQNFQEYVQSHTGTL